MRLKLYFSSSEIIILKFVSICIGHPVDNNNQSIIIDYSQFHMPITLFSNILASFPVVIKNKVVKLKLTI